MSKGLPKGELPNEGIPTWGGVKAVSSAGKFFGWNNKIYGRSAEHATVYMQRFWIGRLRLHIFHRGDYDPDHHDHPWNFWTFPLNSYVEEVVVPFNGPKIVLNVVKRWRITYRPATHTHRVLGPYTGEHDLQTGLPIAGSGKIVTIIWRSKPNRKWGFLKNRNGKWCWVAWKEYVFAGGKDAPCE